MEEIAEGKTKRILKLKNNRVEIVSKSDITAGDGERKDRIEGKDILANNTTCNIFKLLNRKGLNTHFIGRESANSFVAKNCIMIPIEVVERRRGTGSYLSRHPYVKDGTIFDEVKVEFFYKDDKLHDPIIVTPFLFKGEIKLYDAKKPIDSNTYIKTIESPCSEEEFNYMREQASKVFSILEGAFRKLGIVLWDLKIEFGRTADGEVVVADVIDNDSWRIRTEDGEQLDKQLYRDGEDLEKVKRGYEIVSNLTDKFKNL